MSSFVAIVYGRTTYEHDDQVSTYLFLYSVLGGVILLNTKASFIKMLNAFILSPAKVYGDILFELAHNVAYLHA